MLDWRRRGGKKQQQERCHGKKASASVGDATGNVRTASDHVSSVWKSDAHGPSQPSDGDNLARSHSVDPQSVSVPRYSLSALPSANASGGRRRMGSAAWRIRAGCDRAGGRVEVPAAAQYPADPRGPAATRTRGSPTNVDRSALPI